MAITQNCRTQAEWGQQADSSYSSSCAYPQAFSPEQAHPQHFPWQEYYAHAQQHPHPRQTQQQEYQYCFQQHAQHHPSQLAWPYHHHQQQCGSTALPPLSPLSPQSPSGLNGPELVYQWMHAARRAKQEENKRLPSEDGKAQKKQRTIFTNEQIVQLEIEFNNSRYLCRGRMLELASGIGLSERQVKIWFQNRRMKAKKEKAFCPQQSLAACVVDHVAVADVPTAMTLQREEQAEKHGREWY